jgi:molybdenum cofactor biosynthesis enzyme MoaA
MLNPKIRIDFAGHGEPLLNPNHLEIFSRFREFAPRSQLLVTTNGATLRKRMARRLDELFGSGIDLIILDTYEPERRALQAEAESLRGRFNVVDYYRDCLPAKWSPWANHNGKVSRTVVIMDDLARRSGESKTRVMDNRGGNRPTAKPVGPFPRKCTMPFRTMVVTWEGKAIICCMDWKQLLVAGDVVNEGAEAVWRGPVLEAARAMLYSKNRSFLPCARCDKGAGPRVGLLPKYPKPTPRQIDLLKGCGR